jgi:hypothetical protein
MRPAHLRFILLAGLLLLACRSFAQTRTGAAYDPTSLYQKRTLQGFTLYIHPKALEREKETGIALRLLEEKLSEIVRIMPDDRLKRLRQFAIWIEWEGRFPTAMVCHVSAEWLRENGHNPDKELSVEMVHPPKFVQWTTEDQPMMVLHELAHAYHYKFLTRQNPDVLKAFDSAVKSGKYEMVPYVRGQKLRAYALTNDTEYFAELTEAYFGRNDFYPFTRDELKAFDPEGYALMERVWGKPKEEIKRP